jgi:hypothetical protein
MLSPGPPIYLALIPPAICLLICIDPWGQLPALMLATNPDARDASHLNTGVREQQVQASRWRSATLACPNVILVLATNPDAGDASHLDTRGVQQQVQASKWLSASLACHSCARHQP